jgi:AraC-like DNA-binding protein
VLETSKSFFRQLLIERDNERWGLYVAAAGRVDIPDGRNTPHASYPESYQYSWEVGRALAGFCLVWLAQGRGEIEFEEMPLSPLPRGSVILLPPGGWHRYRPLEQMGWTEYWVHFDGTFARQLLASGAIPTKPAIITALSQEALANLFNRLLGRLMHQPRRDAQMTAADLFQLIAVASEQVGGIETGNGLVFEAVRTICTAGRETITVDELVAEMLVARRTLERAFRKQLGHGVHEEILQRRLERTLRLLANLSLSIEEVAIESGFGNVRSLRRAFVTANGMSPQAYRNLIASDPKAA